MCSVVALDEEDLGHALPRLRRGFKKQRRKERLSFKINILMPIWITDQLLLAVIKLAEILCCKRKPFVALADVQRFRADSDTGLTKVQQWLI